MFCSSISTALRSPSDLIPDEPLEGFHCALTMGYGLSKLVGERIVSAARGSSARAYSLRIGQVSGHSKKGLWNDSEAVPLMIRSALTLKALPKLDQTCSWFPVDLLAMTILELSKACSQPNENLLNPGSGSPTDDTVYNLCNFRTFTWQSLLESLERGGFDFETLSFEDWLKKLRDSEARGEEQSNPAIKLIDHYQSMYGEKTLGSQGQKTFITDKAERDSVTLRSGPLHIIEDGVLERYIHDWLTRWVRV
ncbi:hypothetical protein N7474_008724 [Penicillium riverlandense]|uniref:uncharacterized protein n=1 Tax=Penicillium riverlandense TaxID=1903569 RepID=UPI0025477E99|nr:uncharacterized protein N7474_008724 [Penicillium riverlandense]KAJ5812423.1 hypothetical protein N7474_008724 [Penicillium riverlandense]